jgi:hypothetical protein
MRQPYCDMPEPTPELARLEELDAVRVDDDVEGGAGDADDDGGERHRKERLPGIGEAEELSRRPSPARRPATASCALAEAAR